MSLYDRWVADRLLRQLDNTTFGRLSLTMPDGAVRVYGGSSSGPVADIALHDWKVPARLATRGDSGFMDDYRDRRWSSSNLENLLTFALQNESALASFINGGWLASLAGNIAHRLRPNSLRGSRRNIHAHYDLGNDFYRLWLDPGMTYSSALFTDENTDLTSAQDAKYDRLLDRLTNRSGRLLEVGCGWGGLAVRAMAHGDYAVRGLTLSAEQQTYAQNRLGNTAEIALQDYRHQSGLFDHIVSIEMFEAVGEKYWPIYFTQIGRLLRRGGRAVMQTITIDDARFAGYRRGIDCIRAAIFPGGMLPSPPRFSAEVAKAGLRDDDHFFFGRDYARTLECWLANFDQAKPAVRALGFDEEFVRIWRFYLAACIAGFRTGRTDVMQVVLQHA